MAEAVRDLGFLSWKDPRAWMEPMKGAQWDRLVAAEAARFERALGSVAEKEDVESLLTSFQAAKEKSEVGVGWTIGDGRGGLVAKPQSGGAYSWTWVGEPATAQHPLVGDLWPLRGGEAVLYTRDVGRGAEYYEICLERRSGEKVWSYRGPHGVGSVFAVCGSHVYILEAESPLRFQRLIRLSVKTGKGRELLYEETARSWALSLVKGEGGCLFLVAENAGRQRLWHVEGRDLTPLSPEGVCFVPVGYGPGSSDPVYWVRRGSVMAPWTVCGGGRPWSLPAWAEQLGVAFVHLRSRIAIFKEGGRLRVATVSPKEGVVAVKNAVGDVSVNPWARWEGRQKLRLEWTQPGATPQMGWLYDGRLTLTPPLEIYASKQVVATATSRDGTEVPWILVWSCDEKPTRLCICGYGAYGISTSLDTTRWRPALERGWAIGFALVRGGGDGSELWAEMGRREGKERGVEDLEACVREMQRRLGVGARATCIYGRSAGGYLVGTATARNPGGELFGSVYTEVPYVDVLRTASNPRLPLTEYEYLEFGDPAHNPQDFATLLRLSPVDALGPGGAPGVFVLCRTAVNDRQVYAYESFKWVDALRGKAAGGKPKLVGLNHGQGHFTRGDQLYVDRSEDLILLETATQ